MAGSSPLINVRLVSSDAATAVLRRNLTHMTSGPMEVFLAPDNP